MGLFKVSAKVEVEVEIEFEAEDESEALAWFDSQIAMNATLLDMDPKKFDVNVDTIMDICDLKVEKTS